MIAVISLFVITLDTVTFTDYPTEDVTVGSVQFACSATAGGTRRDVSWGIQLPEVVAPDIFTSNKTLILTKVSRELDRATIQCRASDGVTVSQQTCD